MNNNESLIDIAEGIIKTDNADLKLDFWQKYYLREDHPFMIVSKSRRIGWSFVTALKGLILANNTNRYKYDKQFVSYSHEDAKEKINFAREFYHSLPKKYRKEIYSDQKTQLEFWDVGKKSVSRLISLPCKMPRGRGSDISLDEFAFHAKDEQIYSASLPVIARGGYSIEIGSTPFGNKGKFHEIMTNEKRYPSFKRISLYWWFSSALCKNVTEAVHKAPDMTTQQRVEKYGTDILKEIFQSMGLDDFQQEFECAYRDELAAFITLEMIQACTPFEENEEIIPFKTIDEFIIGYRRDIHGTLYAGYDVGRTNNAAVLTILGVLPDSEIKTCWASIEYKKIKFRVQEDNLSKALSNLPIHRMCIDSTGMGMELAENLEDKFLRRVEGITFSNPVIEEMANNLYLTMERIECLLPSIRDLQVHIHSIRKITTVSKKSRFDCDANAKHHADRFFSLCLALHAVVPGKKKDFYAQWKDLQKKGVKGKKKKKGITPYQVIQNIKRIKRW